MRNSDALQAAVAFYDAVAKGRKPPQYSWRFGKDGGITVEVQGKPSSVKLWQAVNPKTRDFRLMTIGPAYKSTSVTPGADGKYAAAPAKPAQGWTAYFVEITWPGETKYPYKFTTPVRVWPERYPHAAFQPNPAKRK
jgi:PhoPQ-activated pathogenicity-related protein